MTTDCNIVGFQVIAEKCTGCERCIQFCPVEAIEIADHKATIDKRCTKCGVCSTECPEHAIVEECGTENSGEDKEVRLDNLM